MPAYDFSNHADRLAYLQSLPKRYRRAWIERFHMEHGDGDELKRELIEWARTTTK